VTTIPQTRFAWMVSYPKSGNTWMRMMLHALHHGKLRINANHDVHIFNRNEFEHHMGFESSDLTQEEIDLARPEAYRAMARNLPDCLLLRKVHDRYWKNAAGEPVFPADVSKGAIYIVRDPRDVAVSYAHHSASDIEAIIDGLADPNETIDQSTTALVSKFSQPLGHWSEHVTSWLDQTEIPVLLVRYEDMLQDATRELMRVAEFLDLPKAGDEEACARAAAASSFENLRAQEEKKDFVERATLATRFFRSGRSGEGLEVLPAPLLEKVERDHGKVMRRLGYRTDARERHMSH